MTRREKPAGLARKKLAVLHVARRDLALDDESYRAILQRHGGASSAADLSEAGFIRVMTRLKELGFISSSAKRTFGVRAGMATPAQVATIRKLWAQFRGAADPDDVTLNAWVERSYRVSALRFVDSETASKAITGLKAMVARSKHQN